MKLPAACLVFALALAGCAHRGGPITAAPDMAAPASPPAAPVTDAAAESAPAATPPAPSRPGSADLVLAARFGQEETVRNLLDQGVDVNGRDALGRTPLIGAAGERQPAVLRLLLARGAELGLQDRDGMNALMTAVINGRKDNVRLLLEAGADLEALSPAGETALMVAIRAGQADLVDYLLARGADPDVHDQDDLLTHKGYTPLMYAARYGVGDDGMRMLRSLIAHRAAAGARRPNGETALTIAQRNGRQDMAAELARLGARDESPYAGMGAGDALIKAIRLGDPAKVRGLLDAAADPNFRNTLTGVTPLAAAAFYGRLEAAELLIARGARIDNVPWGLKDDRIAASGLPADQRELLKAVARGDTALISSVRRDDVAAVRMLLERHAPVGQPNRAGDTPGVLAVRSGNAAIVHELLAHGLDPDATRYPPRVNYLLAHVARGEGTPPLLIAAVQTGRQEVVEALLKAGADPDIRDPQGRTALYWAAAGNQADIIRLLIAHKASPDIRDRFGATALDIAQMNGHQQAAALISGSLASGSN
jgi:ankyrin repeat protein